MLIFLSPIPIPHKMRNLIATVLAAVTILSASRAEQAVISEVMYHPADTRPEYVEIWNISNTPLDFAKWRLTDGITYEFPDFTSGSPQAIFLKPNERIVVSSADAATTRTDYGIPASVRIFGPWTGALDNAGEKITLQDKNGVVVTQLEYKDGGRWPREADGAGYSIVLRNENNKIDDFHNWRASQLRGGSPGTVEGSLISAVSNPELVVSGVSAVVDFNGTWKYNVPASDPGSTWKDLSFDDSSWSAGSGLLGYSDAPGAIPSPGLQTSLPGTSMVYLFRKTFNFDGDPASVTYTLDQVADDGVAYYLNGQLLGSVGYTPGGAWDAASFRSVSATIELNTTTNLKGAIPALVNGPNVLTAELHKWGAGATQAVFGAKVNLIGPPAISINEVLPAAAGTGFIEFYNSTSSPINLLGYYISNSSGNLTAFQISSNLEVPGFGFAKVGYTESGLTVGATTVIYLTKPDGTSVVNAISSPIPLDGRSLGRDPAGGNTWFLFREPTPNGPNGANGNLRLSEVHFDADGNADWVELQNTGPSAQPVSGLYLSSTADHSDQVSLTGNVPGSGFASFPVSLASDAGDLIVYLTNAAGKVLSVAEIEHQPGLDSVQAIYPVVPTIVPSWELPKSAAEWYSSPTDTKDALNNPPLTTSVVINEIMCDPPSNQTSGEFVELYNKSGSPVNLTGWKLRGGIDFDFPSGASIPPGGYLVVGGDVVYLQAAYPSATVVGNWSGTLGNNGDLIRLVDQNGNLADEVDYKVGGDWPVLAAGQGSSLELINPDMDNSRSSAWRASDETNKAAFQTFTVTGTYLQQNSLGSVTDYKELHLHLVGDSHCVVRNVTVTPNGGSNILTNSTVLSTNGSSASGWLCQGTHWSSFVSGGELHLVADGHGDNRANRAEIDCTGLTQNAIYTISFEARWISGKPRLIAQTWDHSIGSAFLVPIPNNLGTAGAANSIVQASPLPQVDSLLHSPAVPKPTDPVKITARVYSALPLTAVQAFVRLDTVNNSQSFAANTMYDDATHGDAVAGDGIYTVTITNHQVLNRIVQFYVRATAQGGGTLDIPRLGPARPALWMVDNRNISTQLRRQRFVMSAYDRSALTTASGQSATYQFDFPRLSNHYFNCTFISNESDVYYNAELRKSGSPWTRTDGSELNRGKWKVPTDRLFRAREKSTYDNDADPNGNSSVSQHHNRLIRYWLYVLGHPVNENEFVYNLINADALAIREDTEPVDGEMVSRCFPDGNKLGQLMRSDDEWWFQDDWNRTNRNADWSYKGTASPIAYHTEWMARSREEDYDYGPLSEFFKTVSNGGSTEEQLRRVMDPEKVLMMAAVRGYAYDWDSLTLTRGKNGFFYRRPDDGRWIFLHWDSDLAFQDSSNIVVGGLAGWSTFISQAWTRRIFNYYLTEMLGLTSGTKAARTVAFLDAEEAASSAYTVNKAFYTSWFSARTARVQQEINLAVGTGGTSNALSTSFSVTTAGGTTASSTVNILGTAPSSGFRVQVQNHPEATFRWLNQTTWQISGLVLATGLNTFTVQMVDQLGNVIGTTTYSITKTGNAPPVMAMTISPSSQNAVLGSQVSLDAGPSYDPDGGVLTFAWDVSPATGFTISQPTPASRLVSFSTPGVYAFTATGTDSGSASAPITREVTAYAAADFSSFSANRLESFWTAQNVEVRDNTWGSAYYSLEDTPNNLVMEILDDSAKPLNFANPTYPALFRPLPASSDFSLQTDLSLETRRTGTFSTGLLAEVVESGATVRYAFGFNGGNNLVVRRISQASASNLVSPASTGTSAVFRIRRVGNQLRFERRNAGVWASIFSQTLPAGTTCVKGGIFIASTAAERARVAFDYVLLADPASTASVGNNLRITEIMYNPKEPSTVEFIELTNTGASPINLEGVHFVQGNPVDAYTFGNVNLAPGQYIVLTNDSAAFQAQYGFAPFGQWPGGSLSNGGETIELRDANNNIVHDFDFDDVAPWPLTPDGQGPSLEVVSVNGDYGNGTNWRASFEIGGSPGYTGAGPDTDGDGQPDSWEALFGTNPNDPNSRFVATTTVNGSGQPQVSWPSIAGINYRVDYSNSLSSPNWQPLATIPGTGSPLTFTDTTQPMPSQRFYKVIPLLQ